MSDAQHPRDRDPILARSVFPILPWERVEPNTLIADVEDEVGTAFCISENGWFVTAEHLVKQQPYAGAYKIFLLDRINRQVLYCEVGQIVRFPDADVAFLQVAIPEDAELRARPLPIGIDELQTEDAVFLFGFPNAKHELRPGRPEAPGLYFEMDSAFREGVILDRFPNGYMVPGRPVYVTSCDAPSGMSGAPLISAQTGTVHGVLSSSIIGSHSVCTDLGDIFRRFIEEAAKDGRIGVRKHPDSAG